MKHFTPTTESASSGALIAFHLLGTVDFDACQALQARLVYEAGEREDQRIVVLLAEHAPLITIGRSGSRGHVRLSETRLRQAQLSTRWVSRGGGVVLHQPGQLAIYPIVPLARRGWLVGEYLQRLKQSLVGVIESLGVKTLETPGQPGISGRTGVLATLGVAVRNEVAFQGAWLNVHPPAQFNSQLDVISPENTGAGSKSTPGSLLAERREPVTMARVRAVLIEQLAAAFDCPRQHVHSGHPLYQRPSREPSGTRGAA